MREYGCPRRPLRPRHIVLPDFPQMAADERHYGTEAILYVAIASAVMSAAIGAYASYASSQAQAGAMEYNALLAQQQAAYGYQQAQQQAAYAGMLGEMEAGMMERQAAGMGAMAEAELALAESQAKAAQAAGDIREAGLHRAYDRTQSDVRAAIGKSGVDTTGSPLLVLMENADTVGMELAINDYQTALDVAGAKTSGAFSAAESRMRADALQQSASLRRFGAQATSAGYLGSGQNALLTGAGQAGMLNMQAGGVRSAGMLGVGTSLLGGISAASSPFLRYGSGTTPRGGYSSGSPAFG